MDEQYSLHAKHILLRKSRLFIKRGFADICLPFLQPGSYNLPGDAVRQSRSELRTFSVNKRSGFVVATSVAHTFFFSNRLKFYFRFGFLTRCGFAARHYPVSQWLFGSASATRRNALFHRLVFVFVTISSPLRLRSQIARAVE